MLKTRKRCLALLLCLGMLISCIPPVYAADGTAEPAKPETEAVTPDTTDDPPKTEEPPESASPDEAVIAEETPQESLISEEDEPVPETEEITIEEPVVIEEPILRAAAASTSYTFSSIVTSSQMTSANNYLNYTGGSGTKAVPIHQVTFGGKTYWAYCGDSRKDWPGSSYSNYTQESLPDSGMYQVQKVAMQLGFGDNNTARLKTMFGYDLSNYEAYQATQVVLWAAQVWVNQWHYIGSAPGSIRDGVSNYWKVATPSGKSANARNFALTLADAVQSVYENGIGCDISIVEDTTSVTARRFKITVKPKNYYGGYSAAITGLPSGATLTSSDGDVTVSKANAFSSTASSGTDTLYLTIPKTASAQSLSVTVTVTPTIQVYSTNSAVGYLESGSSTYQPVLYAAGSLSAAPVSQKATLSVPRLPTGKVTITKLDADTKKPVPNVVFALYEFDGSSYVNTGKTAKSNANGIAEFTGLQYNAANLGRYRVFEVSSDTHEVWTNRYVCWFSLASGLWYSYESATSEQKTGTATANTSGSYDFTLSFIAYNKELVKNGSLTILKRNGDGKAVPKVSFVITDEKGTSILFSKNSDGVYVPNTKGSAQLTTDSKGQIKVDELPFGTYLVTEVAVSDGSYSLLPTAFTVKLPYTDSKGNDQLDLTYTVVNSSSFQLPATGGSGLSIPIFGGLALLAALLMLATKSKHKGDLAL